MVASASKSRIVLSDPDIEDSDTLESLLSVILHGRFPLGNDSNLSTSTARLAMKLDCDLALEWIVVRTQMALAKSNECAHEAFLIGVILDDVDICVQALQKGGGTFGDQKEAGTKESEFGEYRKGGALQDPATLDLEDLASLKTETLWAWLRAFRNTFGPFDVKDKDKKKFAELGKEFRRLMKLEGAL